MHQYFCAKYTLSLLAVYLIYLVFTKLISSQLTWQLLFHDVTLLQIMFLK